MSIAHNLGFPRIGAQRELKRMLESYWEGTLERQTLLDEARALRARHWQLQATTGMQMVPVGDFAWYDHVLNHSMMFGNVPERFGNDNDNRLDLYLRMARGRAPSGPDTPACEMTKWFDTNYHYIVPEFHADRHFQLNAAPLLQELAEARALGIPTKPVIVGPVTYLWLGKARDGDRLALLDRLLPIYAELLDQLHSAGAEWVQVDEPLLVQDLEPAWQEAYRRTYHELRAHGPRKLLCTYFGGLDDNLDLALELPLEGLHLDRVRGRDSLPRVLEGIGSRVLSLGVVNGRNVWRTDLDRALADLEPAAQELGERLWVGPSCSLIHVPVDLETETGLDPELKSWLAFATQKLAELNTLARLLTGGGEREQAALQANREACRARRESVRTHNPAVRTAHRRYHRGHVPASISLRHAHPAAARASRPASLPDHHHRLVPADHRDTQGPARVQERHAQRAELPRTDAGRDQGDHPYPGGPRPGRAGARRGRAQRHGGVLRRATRRLCLHH